MFAWSLRSRPANMRGMVCFANRPARPAEPGETIALRGLRPLKLPRDGFDLLVGFGADSHELVVI